MIKIKDPVYTYVCQYNGGILCDKKVCWKCGWNPEVDKERRERIGKREECLSGEAEG